MSQEKRVRTFVSISQKICMFMWLWYNIATSFATNSRSVDCLTVLKIWLQILTLLQAAFALFDLNEFIFSFIQYRVVLLSRTKKKDFDTDLFGTCGKLWSLIILCPAQQYQPDTNIRQYLGAMTSLQSTPSRKSYFTYLSHQYIFKIYMWWIRLGWVCCNYFAMMWL